MSSKKKRYKGSNKWLLKSFRKSSRAIMDNLMCLRNDNPTDILFENKKGHRVLIAGIDTASIHSEMCVLEIYKHIGVPVAKLIVNKTPEERQKEFSENIEKIAQMILKHYPQQPFKLLIKE